MHTAIEAATAIIKMTSIYEYLRIRFISSILLSNCASCSITFWWISFKRGPIWKRYIDANAPLNIFHIQFNWFLLLLLLNNKVASIKLCDKSTGCSILISSTAQKYFWKCSARAADPTVRTEKCQENTEITITSKRAPRWSVGNWARSWFGSHYRPALPPTPPLLLRLWQFN